MEDEETKSTPEEKQWSNTYQMVKDLMAKMPSMPKPHPSKILSISTLERLKEAVQTQISYQRMNLELLEELIWAQKAELAMKKIPKLKDCQNFAKKLISRGNSGSDSEDQEMQDESRPTMKITKCPHTDRKHYAKNMCNNCYHKLGRKKMAWACAHTDKLNYAKGKC